MFIVRELNCIEILHIINKVRATDWDDSHNPEKISNFKKHNEPQGNYRVSRKIQTSRKIRNFEDAVNRSVDVT